MTLSERIAAARGQVTADLLLTNLQLVNVFSGEVYPAQIAIKDSIIVGVGEGYAAANVVDLGGRYVAPGLIDAHVHIESSMCTPPAFSQAALAHGVTSVITDPHEIANVHGLDGIRFMLDSAAGGVLSMYVMASSCVPATHMETAGAALSAADLRTLLGNPWVLGLAEMMNYPGVIFGDPEALGKIEAFAGRVLDGHCPGLRGNDLNAYIAAGIASDHECTTVDEAREKLQKGMVIFIREATNARNLRPLLPLVTPENSRRICFCTDDRQPADLLDDGSIDHMVRVAIAEGGLDPVTAIRMATLNTAEYFRLGDRGGIAPGRRADLIVFSDLRAPRAEQVYCGGTLVAQDGALTVDLAPPQVEPLPRSVRIDWDAVDLAIPARGERLRVIGSIPNQLVTEHRIEDARIENGRAVADVARDILKMAVIERHNATGKLGKGFIHGIGLRRGAIAGTVAHDHHNLVVIGADDASMLAAARAVERMGGGLVAVDGERVLAELPLPVGGLMSDRPIGEVRAALDRLLDAARRELGSPLHDPFMAMSFMALEVIPSLKLTDVGLVDVDQFEVVDLFV
ncbi:MAG: adenine deaminase [Chloroflexi bacterium]|nr:adenine deaminase [Chloroflexota bacterium]